MTSEEMEARLAGLQASIDQIWRLLIMEKIQQTNETLDDLRRMIGDVPAEAGPALDEPVSLK